jgi:hypothetical protein
MSEKKPPDGSGGSQFHAPGGMSFDITRKLSNETPGEKFLVMKRIGNNGSMDGVSPFLVTKAIEGVAQGRVQKISWLRNGTVLIKTVNLKQAMQLVKLTGLSPIYQVEVSEHNRLNSSKGVIRTRMLSSVSDEEFLSEMKSQNIIGIYRVKRKIDNVEKETGVYFLTFATCEPPETINMCYESVRVTPYVIPPMRCWNCLKFNHTKNFCSERKNCANCGQEFHLTEEFEVCDLPKSCVNCGGPHSSLDRKCPTYQMHREINAIMAYNKLSLREARIIYQQRNPGISFAQVVSQNAKTLNQHTCQCQHQQSNNEQHQSTQIRPNRPPRQSPTNPTNQQPTNNNQQPTINPPPQPPTNPTIQQSTINNQQSTPNNHQLPININFLSNSQQHTPIIIEKI